jgi:hypothetical protein
MPTVTPPSLHHLALTADQDNIQLELSHPPSASSALA